MHNKVKNNTNNIKYFMSSNRLSCYMYTALFIIIFVIAGLICMQYGCNTHTTQCDNSNIKSFHGFVTNKVVYTNTCYRCKSKCDKNKNKYTCYDAYVYAFIHNNTNNTDYCRLQTKDNTRNISLAQQSYVNYDIGTQVNWYRKIGTNQCLHPTDLYYSWLAGVVLLSIAGILSIYLVILWLCYKYNKYKYLYKNNEINNKIIETNNEIIETNNEITEINNEIIETNNEINLKAVKKGDYNTL